MDVETGEREKRENKEHEEERFVEILVSIFF